MTVSSRAPSDFTGVIRLRNVGQESIDARHETPRPIRKDQRMSREAAGVICVFWVIMAMR